MRIPMRLPSTLALVSLTPSFAPNMKYFIHWVNKFIGYTDQE